MDNDDRREWEVTDVVVLLVLTDGRRTMAERLHAAAFVLGEHDEIPYWIDEAQTLDRD